MKNQNHPALLPGQIQVIKKGSTSANQITQLIESAFKKFAPKRKRKMPMTVTQGENWACFAFVVGDMCVTINFTEMRKEARYEY